MRYTEFSLEDFINDQKFREWVLHPDPESNYFWEKWILKNPDKEEEINEARIAIKAMFEEDKAMPLNKKDDLWNKITDQIGTMKTLSGDEKVRPLYQHKVNKPFHPPTRNRSWFKISVAVALFLVTTLGGIWISLSSKVENIKEGSTMISKNNPMGRKSRISLPDGTVVYLNAGSKITYPDFFDEGTRDIYLEGEAFFDIEHDPSRPFKVHAQGLITTALGTSFNVNAYNDRFQVSLVTGKVEVKDLNNNNSILLSPGEKVNVSENQTMVKSDFNYDQVVAWKDGVIFFQEADLPEMVEKLERWYGVQFKLENQPTSEVRFSGKFENEYLNNVLNSIGYAVGFDYSINEKNVSVSFK
ncbi:MAG: FecR domain-containing protein [Bacteroidota bacterium]